MARNKELVEKCKEYKIKIKDIKKQNNSFKSVKRKISDILRLNNFVPFTHSVGLKQQGCSGPCPSSSEPSIGLIHRSNFRRTKKIRATHRQTNSISISSFLKMSIPSTSKVDFVDSNR